MLTFIVFHNLGSIFNRKPFKQSIAKIFYHSLLALNIAGALIGDSTHALGSVCGGAHRAVVFVDDHKAHLNGCGLVNHILFNLTTHKRVRGPKRGADTRTLSSGMTPGWPSVESKSGGHTPAMRAVGMY